MKKPRILVGEFEKLKISKENLDCKFVRKNSSAINFSPSWESKMRSTFSFKFVFERSLKDSKIRIFRPRKQRLNPSSSSY